MELWNKIKSAKCRRNYPVLMRRAVLNFYHGLPQTLNTPTMYTGGWFYIKPRLKIKLNFIFSSFVIFVFHHVLT